MKGGVNRCEEVMKGGGRIMEGVEMEGGYVKKKMGGGEWEELVKDGDGEE